LKPKNPPHDIFPGGVPLFGGRIFKHEGIAAAVLFHHLGQYQDDLRKDRD
jgi:hypothetical protein